MKARTYKKPLIIFVVIAVVLIAISLLPYSLIVRVSGFFELLQPIFAVSALGAGLWWFVKRRELNARVNVQHRTTFRDIGDKTYVGVFVKIQNIGKVKFQPVLENDYVSQVVIENLDPYLAKSRKSQSNSPEYKLQFIGRRYFPKVFIEPGEEQEVLFEFTINKKVKAVKIYSFIQNVYNKSSVGWGTTTIHEVEHV